MEDDTNSYVTVNDLKFKNAVTEYDCMAKFSPDAPDSESMTWTANLKLSISDRQTAEDAQMHSANHMPASISHIPDIHGLTSEICRSKYLTEKRKKPGHDVRGFFFHFFVFTLSRSIS